MRPERREGGPERALHLPRGIDESGFPHFLYLLVVLVAKLLHATQITKIIIICRTCMPSSTSAPARARESSRMYCYATRVILV